MIIYALARSVYRYADRAVFNRLPASADLRLRRWLFKLARRWFPAQIQSRSIGEFIGTAPSRQDIVGRLPAWAEAEVAVLAAIEPQLHGLLDDAAALEAYFIPWDMSYVGSRYAAARRLLAGPHAGMALVGHSDATITMECFDSLPRPLALIDVDDDTEIARVAKAAGATYVALPAEQLNNNDHCAVLARLVLQVAPAAVGYLPTPLLERCVQRHGLAMSSVTKLQVLAASPGRLGGGTAAPPTSL